MLVLSRKPGERIKVDGPAEFEILEVIGNKVRVGIIADRSTNVTRPDAKRKLGRDAKND